MQNISEQPSVLNAVKPEFLCIGSPKCGTTWLHDLLSEHPDVFLPLEIKEIHFFDRYIDRGEDWYQNLFRARKAGQVAGEVTPHYLYSENCSSIYQYNPDFKLILLYRDPVQRCLSHYKYRQRLDGFSGSFQEFLENYPQAIEWGLYGKYLARVCSVFPAENILVKKFEDAVENVDSFKSDLAEFLQIDKSKFPATAGLKKINQHMNPRFPWLYRVSVRISRWMVEYNLYAFRNTLKKYLVGFLKKESGKPLNASIVSDVELDSLRKLYLEDQKVLENLIVNCNEMSRTSV